MASEPEESQSVLLRGEVVEISQREGRRFLTVALDAHSLVAPTEPLDDTHLGDRVRLEAEFRVVRVVPEPLAGVTAGRGSRDLRGSRSDKPAEGFEAANDAKRFKPVEEET